MKIFKRMRKNQSPIWQLLETALTGSFGLGIKAWSIWLPWSLATYIWVDTSYLYLVTVATMATFFIIAFKHSSREFCFNSSVRWRKRTAHYCLTDSNADGAKCTSVNASRSEWFCFDKIWPACWAVHRDKSGRQSDSIRLCSFAMSSSRTIRE